METRELQARLSSLDNTTKRLGTRIQDLRNYIHSQEQDAINYRSRAAAIMNSISSEDDDSDASAKIREADLYMSRADGCEEEAQRAAGEVNGLINELKGCRDSYNSYRNLGLDNINNLQSTIGKLSLVTGSKYGSGGAMQSALNESNQRLSFNQKLVVGCEQRMRWIDSI